MTHCAICGCDIITHQLQQPICEDCYGTDAYCDWEFNNTKGNCMKLTLLGVEVEGRLDIQNPERNTHWMIKLGPYEAHITEWNFGFSKYYSIPGITRADVTRAVIEYYRLPKTFDSIDREKVKWILLDNLNIPEEVELGTDFDENNFDDEEEVEMPGSISDSYDPEFSTGARATAVREAIEEQRDRLTQILGKDLLPIVDIAENDFKNTLPIGFTKELKFTERELRIIRFALNRAIESI
jgi:hypothetical protein